MRNAADVGVEDQAGRSRAWRQIAEIGGCGRPGRRRARRLRKRRRVERIGALQVDEALVARRVSAVAVRVRRILAVAIGDLGRREPEHVALDRELHGDAVFLLLVHVAEVRVVAPVFRIREGVDAVLSPAGTSVLHWGSLALVPKAHEVHAALLTVAGSPDWQADVPRGGGKVLDMKFHPVPPNERTSTSESSSSVNTMIASSESGRRKSARCARIVVSTPTHWALNAALVLLPATRTGRAGSGSGTRTRAATRCRSRTGGYRRRGARSRRPGTHAAAAVPVAVPTTVIGGGPRGRHVHVVAVLRGRREPVEEVVARPSCAEATGVSV